MPLKTIVKVGTITNLSDARYCAGMNVDLLGFVTVEGRENYLPVAAFQDIRGWFSGPKVVAEVYGATSREHLQKIVEEYRPDYLELSEAELPFADTALPLLLRAQYPVSGTLPLYGIITSQPTAIAPTLPADVLLFVESRDTKQIDYLLEQQIIDGIVLNGSQETSPGLKDYDELAEVLEALEVE